MDLSANLANMEQGHHDFLKVTAFDKPVNDW